MIRILFAWLRNDNVSREQKVGNNVPVSSLVVVVVVAAAAVVAVVNKHADVAGHADRIQVVYGLCHHSEKWCGLY